MKLFTRYICIVLIATPFLHSKEPITSIIIKQSQTANPQKMTVLQPRITIWVHGTNMSFGKLFNKCPLGLNAVSAFPEKSHIKKMAKILSDKDSQRFQFDKFYSFGWSGKLSAREREAQGKVLLQECVKLRDNLEKELGTKPQVCIITHSHGGGLTLNLPKAKDEKLKDFVIDELVLLACPVQKITSSQLKDPIFKKVYHFYSQIDLLQIADPQGVSKHAKEYKKQTHESVPLFSERRFAPQDNLAQGYIRYKSRALTHLDFILPRIMRNLPAMLAELDTAFFNSATKPVGIFALRIR
jgi:hypothetical protein